MDRQTKDDFNYKINMAGKVRTIPQVKLNESRFGDGYVLTPEEFKRISLWFVTK